MALQVFCFHIANNHWTRVRLDECDSVQNNHGTQRQSCAMLLDDDPYPEFACWRLRKLGKAHDDFSGTIEHDQLFTFCVTKDGGRIFSLVVLSFSSMFFILFYKYEPDTFNCAASMKKNGWILATARWSILLSRNP
jgi:hypothetical protein